MNKFLKPYEEIEKENSKDPSNKSIEISSNPADEESWLNYQAEALKLSEKKAKKKAAVTYEDYEDFLSKKVISPEKRDHSGLNLMVPSRIDAVSVGDNSQSKPEKKELALETLASLKESQKELDKKLNKLQKPKSDIPEPKAQIDMDELTGLEMLILSQQNEDSGPKSTDDTSKSRSNMEFSEKVRSLFEILKRKQGIIIFNGFLCKSRGFAGRIFPPKPVFVQFSQRIIKPNFSKTNGKRPNFLWKNLQIGNSQL